LYFISLRGLNECSWAAGAGFIVELNTSSNDNREKGSRVV